MKDIERMYADRGILYLPTFDKAKAVLSIYRKVVWAVKSKAELLFCETMATYGKDLDAALTYLCSFAPVHKQQDFEASVTHLFETKWLIEIIDQAMLRIGDYPQDGKTYQKIIFHYFLSKEKETDDTLMRRVNLERTTYYQKKKEAIALIGLTLWGYALPTLLHELHEGNGLCSALSKVSVLEEERDLDDELFAY